MTETNPIGTGERLKRLEDALAECESEARRFAGFYPDASDGRNTFVMLADKIATLRKDEDERA